MKKYENMNIFAREFLAWANKQDGVIAGYAGEWVESGQKMEQYISEGCNESGEVYDEYYSDEMPNEDAIRAASVAWSTSYDSERYYEPSLFYTITNQEDLDTAKRMIEKENKG